MPLASKTIAAATLEVQQNWQAYKKFYTSCCIQSQVTFWRPRIDIWKSGLHSGDVQAVSRSGSVFHVHVPAIVHVIKGFGLEPMVWQGPVIYLSHHGRLVHSLFYTCYRL